MKLSQLRDEQKSINKKVVESAFFSTGYCYHTFPNYTQFLTAFL